uniref:NADH-ubiquinone oxidoreductase chain 5 n=1 Tax=Pneumocystis oryctolagi TaxID=42067 RepID=A0A8A6W3X6_9ASCO|nr:NADH dehydrogenase subunit 5 [Pneumocystis oryctolagi]QTK22305.1 NADH dehydrogenase subunit 5 [Pneumocystis oryctolagi]
MYSVVLGLPLLSGIVVGLLGRKIGEKGSHVISLLSIILTTFLVFLCFYEVVLQNSPVSLRYGSWLDLDYFSLPWGFYFDELSVSMLIPVLLISSLVQIYSVSYMKGDPHNPRFFCYLSLFTFFMILLVTGDNYLVLFIGWEGVGILSFLLISFWFTRVQANKSALSAILFNRVGDLFFLLGIILLFLSVGSVEYSIVFSLSPYLNKELIFLVGVCFILAATGKSAQLGLHIWLPQAMEGPTPVSALIHAATMVTAGVYLLMRSSPLLEFNSQISPLILFLGGLTALFSSFIGLFQNDLKRIIAYSTCSQLGMMFVALGLSQYNLALFHLINHAFFKALLFLSAGVVIHGLNDEQDLRKMGGLRYGMPLTYTFILIGSLSLMAAPFLTGYYSKDLIIEMTLGLGSPWESLFYWLLTFVALLTSLYSFKLIYLTFFSVPSSSRRNYELLEDVPWSMILPLFILSVFSILWGYLTKELFIGLGSSALGSSLFSFRESRILDIEWSLTGWDKLLPLILSIVGVTLFLFLCQTRLDFFYRFKLTNGGGLIYKFFNQRCGMDLLYNKEIISRVFHWGYLTSRYLDKGALEKIGPWGLTTGLTSLTQVFSKIDTGILRHSAIYICIGFLGILAVDSFFCDSSLLLVQIVAIVLVLTS